MYTDVPRNVLPADIVTTQMAQIHYGYPVKIYLSFYTNV